MDKRLLSIDEGLLIIVDEVVMTPNLFTIIQTKTPGVKQNPGPAVPRRRRGNPPGAVAQMGLDILGSLVCFREEVPLGKGVLP